MNTIPDVIGKAVDEGRRILFSSLKDFNITINEVHSTKDKELQDLSCGTIINQKVLDGKIILYVGFFNPPV